MKKENNEMLNEIISNQLKEIEDLNIKLRLAENKIALAEDQIQFLDDQLTKRSKSTR